MALSKYIIENLKKNKSKFIIMFIMLILCSTLVLFVTDLLNNLMYEMENNYTDIVAAEDLESMILMLQGGAILLVGIVLLIIHNTYSVTISGRKNEFKLLDRMGIYRTRIRRMLLIEAAVLSISAYLVGCILSKILSHIFMKSFHLRKVLHLSIQWYLLLGILLISIISIIVSFNFSKIFIRKKTSKKLLSKNGKKEGKNRKSILIIGCITSFCLLFILLMPNSIWIHVFGKTYADISREVTIAVFVIAAMNSWIVCSLYGLLHFAKKRSYLSMYLALQQNIFNFRRVKSIISSVIIATALFVGFQGLYSSMRETTKTYVRESVNYDTMIIFDDIPEKHIDEIKNILNNYVENGPDKKYSIALNLQIKDEKDKELTISGIEKSYLNLQRFYVINNGDIDNLFDDSEKLNVMFPSKKAKDMNWSEGTTVDRYRYEQSSVVFKIKLLYDPINLKQAFVSREALSAYLYGNENQYNTLYLNGFTQKEKEQILKNFLEINYTDYNMKEFVKQCVDQVTNGTEIIEVILYASVIFVIALIINLFILSIEDRRKTYNELSVLGLDKKSLLLSMIYESVYIYLVGTIIGFIVALPCINIALYMIEEELIFETTRNIPWILVVGMGSICFATILLAVNCIGNSILLKKRK